MRETKIFDNRYEGKFYYMMDEDISVREATLDDMEFIEVHEDDLTPEELYITEKGHTVQYLGDGAYITINRTPLYASDNVSTIKGNQFRLFWSLVRNCKNGTCYGV